MKYFNSNRALALLALFLSCICGMQAADLPECLWFTDSWGGEPTKENQHLFTKVPQIREGVYALQINTPNGSPNWFGLYSDLEEKGKYGENFGHWNLNRLRPVDDNGYYLTKETPMPAMAKNGIISTKFKEEKFQQEAPTFMVNSSIDNATLIVDYNTSMVYIIPADANYFPIVNGRNNAECTGKPTLGNIEKYVSIVSFPKYYLPKGDNTMAMYDLIQDKYFDLNLSHSYTGITSDSYFYQLGNELFEADILNPDKYSSTITSEDSGSVASFWGDQINIDRLPTTTLDASVFKDMYFVGEKTDWWFDTQYMMTETDLLRSIVIPANPGWFKFSTQGWGYNLGTDGVQYRTADGKLAMRTIPNGDNFYLYGTPETTATIDLDRAIVTFDLQADDSLPLLPENFTYIEDTAQYYITPTEHFLPELLKMDECRALANHTYRTFTSSVEIPINDGKRVREYLIFYIDGNQKYFLAPEGDKTILDGQTDISIAYRQAGIDEPLDNCVWTIPATDAGKIFMTLENGKCNWQLPGKEIATVLPEKVYLIGAPQNWDIRDGSMSLDHTADDMYYGEFDIPAGDQMFRFYTELGNWGSGSIGSQLDDFSATYIDASLICGNDYNTYCMDGMGNWNISGWPGGMLYMLLDYTRNNVTFSDSPISHAPFEEPYVKSVVYLYDGTSFEPIEEEKGYNGIFKFNTSTDKEYSIFTKLPTVVKNDEAFYNDALSISNMTPFDNLGVAEWDINEGECKVLRYDGLENQGRGYTTLLNLNDNKIYADSQEYRFAIGTHTQGKRLSYATRHDFADYAVPISFIGYKQFPASILDIPAGQLEIYFERLIDTVTYHSLDNLGADTAVNEVAFDEDHIAKCESYYFWQMMHLFGNWHGGRLAVTRDLCWIDLDNVATLYAHDWADNSDEEIKVSSDGLFHYSTQMESAQDNATIHYFNPLYIGKGGVCMLGSSAPYEYSKSSNYLVATGNVASAPLGLAATSNFNIPAFDKGALEVVYDLKNMTFSATSAEKTLPYYKANIVDKTGEPSEAYITKSSINRDTYSCAVNAGEGIHSIQFYDADGNAMVTENTTLTPDEYGFAYYKVAGDFELQRAIGKKATAERPALNIEMKEYGQLALAYNAKTKMLTVSVPSSEVFYYVSGNRGACVEDTDNAKAQTLHKTDDGKFEGTLTIGDDTYFYLDATPAISGMHYFTKCITPMYYGAENKFDINTNPIHELYALMTNASYDSWYMHNPENRFIKASYDPETFILRMEAGEVNGVESIENANLDVLTIRAANRGIEIISNDATIVDIYDLQGQRVKRVETAVGKNFIPMPKGLYITVGGKVLVK